MEMVKINGQHVVGFLVVLAVLTLINTFVGPHWFGWGASAPVTVTGSSDDVVKAISGLEANLSKDIQTVNNTANRAVEIALKANQTASSKTTSLVTQTGGQTSQLPAGGVVTVTNTMDDKALNDAEMLLAKANRIAADAERFKRDARELDSDEEDDATDLESDIKDSKDDRDEVKADIEDLQDTIYQDWANQARNETAKDLAGQTLTEALDALSSAKEDYKDATSDVEDILKNDEEKSSSVVYLQPGQTTTSGVTGYQSQTEGL